LLDEGPSLRLKRPRGCTQKISTPTVELCPSLQERRVREGFEICPSVTTTTIAASFDTKFDPAIVPS
jgi:hypothetical protein